MDQFFKICAGVLIVCVISLVIDKKEKDLSLVLTICTCCCVCLFIASFLDPVMEFIHALQDIALVDTQSMGVVMKVVGVGIVAEVSSLICQDAGRSALGKVVQIGATVLILWVSLPLFSNLIELVSKMIGGI